MVGRETHLVLAFDFGGTKLASAVVDPFSGRIDCLVQKATPMPRKAQASLEVMAAAGREALLTCSLPVEAVRAIGISFGGPVSPDRRTVLRSMHVQEWEGVNLPEQLSEFFGMPAYMDNDGNAAALGEWVLGAGKGAENMLYVQVSTGIGSGLILKGQVYRGAGLAGELGHMTLLPDGPVCSCGKKGCLESLASGWAIARDGREAQLGGGKGELSKHAPEEIDAEAVLGAYRAGDARAQAIIRRAFDYLGLGIANAVSLLDVEVVVIGGGVARAQDVLLEILPPALERYLPRIFQGRTRLAFSSLQGNETLLGAALLARGFG